MTRLQRLVALTAVAFLVTAVGPVYAIDHGKGHPGYCKTATGVTVVVDFQHLGGTTIVRCNPQGNRGTGLDALKGAGFQMAGVQRWGESFVCRIENRPSAVEELPIKGKEGYKEACVNTPPAGGYWSYWHAGNNCAWTYSQWGVKNRDFIQGGFEGWSFSLNATASSNPQPRIASVRPGTEGEECVAPPEPEPTSGDPNVRQPGASENPGVQPGSGGGTGGGSGGPGTTSPGASRAGTSGALPPPKPRATAQSTVEFTGGETATDVNQLVKEQSGASNYAPWVAGGAVVLLGFATWLTARRRRRARES